MNSLIRFWLLGILVVLTNISIAQSQWSLSELNLTHQYDPAAEIFLKCQATLSNDSLILYIALEINQDKSHLSDYSFDLFLLNSVEDKLTAQTDNLRKDSILLSSFEKEHLLSFALPYNGQNWAVIRVNSSFSGFNHYFEVPLQAMNLPNFRITNSAVETGNYLHPDTYQFSEQVTGFYYNYAFNPAIPPMVSKAPLPEKTMSIDSVFNILANAEFSFTREGLYYFQVDTSTTVGRGFIITHKYYPKPATLEQLKDPLIYITTQNERAQLQQITSKSGFDQFWLELTDSPERAVSIIREFYDRVEFANKSFTSFKEGWKTDPGMIYIIFGTPDEVIKKDQSETWIYLSNVQLPKIQFEFIRTNNIFSSTHYSLIRDNQYSSVWYRAIDLWRKSRF